MDRRIKYTKNIIKETFIDLLQKKDINHITVSEICKIADINRATFYRYYLDVYDLLEKLENEFSEELATAYKEQDARSYSVSNFSTAILQVFLENKKLVSILFNNKNTKNFLNSILDLAYERCKEKWQLDMPNVTEEEIENTSIFIFNGALGIINYWIKNDFDKDVEEISRTIEELSYYGLKKYIYKKKS